MRGQRLNDGWYTFFAPKANGAGHIVVCIRIEDVKGSSVAVRMAGKHVIPVLKELGYVKSFDEGKKPVKEITVEDDIRANEVGDEEQTDSLVR